MGKRHLHVPHRERSARVQRSLLVSQGQRSSEQVGKLMAFRLAGKRSGPNRGAADPRVPEWEMKKAELEWEFKRVVELQKSAGYYTARWQGRGPKVFGATKEDALNNLVIFDNPDIKRIKK